MDEGLDCGTDDGGLETLGSIQTHVAHLDDAHLLQLSASAEGIHLGAVLECSLDALLVSFLDGVELYRRGTGMAAGAAIFSHQFRDGTCDASILGVEARRDDDQCADGVLQTFP